MGIVGALMITEFYISWPEMTRVISEIQRWAVAAAAFTVGLGVVNLTRIHVRHVAKRTKGQWYHSGWLLAIMYLTLIIGLAYTARDSRFKWIFDSLYYPADATIYALLSFFIARACYRVLRVRNLDSGILLVAAFVVLLRSTPIAVAIWGGFVDLDNWVSNILSPASSRGIVITSALGLIVLGLRTLMGRERASIGITEGGS